MKLACIGIGSNAIRLTEGEWKDGNLVILRRERCGTRLFAGLRDGALTEESMQVSVEAIRELSGIAYADGIRDISMFATSAVRDARNGMDFAAACEAAVGVPMEIVSGKEEAALSFWGACQNGQDAVIDIGGGSTEITFGRGEVIEKAVSMEIGAVRLMRSLPITNQKEYDETVQHCTSVMKEQDAMIASAHGRKWVGVGGTMTTLGAMECKIPLFDEKKSEGMCLSAERIVYWGHTLATLSLEERRKFVGLMPQRADIIPSGIAILEAALQVFDISEIQLSARGNMDGYLRRKFLKKG